MGQTTSVVCDFQTTAVSGDTCASVASKFGLTEGGFQSLNPSVSCPGDLVAGQDYCVIGTVTTVTPSSTPSATITVTMSTSSTTAAATTTPSTTLVSSTTTPPTTLATSTTTTAAGAHQPTQSGLASNCNNFHLVVSGDTCSQVESQYGISAANFASWNPAIDSACTNLLLGYYVCVGVPGATSNPTPTGPSPQMPSITSTCNKYYQVQSGNTCQSIEQGQGVSDANFKAWNPYVNAGCSNLWLGYYVCVGVPGASNPTPTGPSPQMPSLTSSCKKFYKIQSGDGCWSIEQANGISASQFSSWNPYVDAGCDNLWLGYYVCVGA